MELNIDEARQWALQVIGNTYNESEVPEIERQFLNWFDKQEGWYDVTTNPSDYLGQGIVTVFMDNFYEQPSA